jgi:hypothetical protein
MTHQEVSVSKMVSDSVENVACPRTFDGLFTTSRHKAQTQHKHKLTTNPQQIERVEFEL